MYTFPSGLWDTLADEFDLKTDYSGRGMFGTRCIGLVGQLGDLLRFIAACQHSTEQAAPSGEDLIDALARSVRCDNLGDDQIYYFPDVTLAGHTKPAQHESHEHECLRAETLKFVGHYGAPGTGQAWQCTGRGENWSRVNGHFSPAREMLHVMPPEQTR